MLAGIAVVGALALVNAIVLYALKADGISYIASHFAQSCTPSATNSTASVEDCFNSVVQIDIPLLAVISFIVSLVLATILGRIFESVPGSGTFTKGIIIGITLFVIFLILGLTGIAYERLGVTIVTVAYATGSIIYGVLFGYLYRRYTKLVQFESGDADSLKVLVDKKDLTGKARTFAMKSIHQVRAEGSQGTSFKEWLVSGGVSVDDSRSYETMMEVNGDGLLKAISKKG
jgi:hypothetical protein